MQPWQMASYLFIALLDHSFGLGACVTWFMSSLFIVEKAATAVI